MWGSRHSFGVFFKPVLDEFGWSRAATSAGFSASWVLTGFLSIIMGRLNDKYGPRKVMTVSVCLLGLGYLLVSQMNSLWQLYLYYTIISIGMSAVLVPPMSTVARWFVRRRALMSGIVLTATGIALMVLVPAANQLILSYGWRMSYIIIGVLVLVIILPTAQLLRNDPTQMGLLPDGDTVIANKKANAQVEGLSFREGIRTRQLWMLSGIYFGAFFVLYTFSVHLIIYATGVGISSHSAVLIVSMIGMGGIVGRILMGVVSDRKGCKFAMVSTAVLMVIGLCILPVGKENLSLLYLFGIVFGFGHGGLATVQSPTVANIFGMRAHGMLLGFVFFCDTIGATIGPIIAGYIFDMTGSYDITFTLTAIIGIITLILVLLLKPIKSLPEKG